MRYKINRTAKLRNILICKEIFKTKIFFYSVKHLNGKINTMKRHYNMQISFIPTQTFATVTTDSAFAQ